MLMRADEDWSELHALRVHKRVEPVSRLLLPSWSRRDLVSLSLDLMAQADVCLVDI